MKRTISDEKKVQVERSRAAAVSRELWRGLVRFNRQQAGPLAYSRKSSAPRRPRSEGAHRRGGAGGAPPIHLNTYSFQAPGFYEKQGCCRRFGAMAGSPKGARRYFYVKRLRTS